VIKMQAVTSSTISEIGYENKSLIFQINFLNATSYQYFDVPRPVFDQLLAPPDGSHGRFFSSAIRAAYRSYSWKLWNVGEKVAYLSG
jgi:hypothetical protein